MTDKDDLVFTAYYSCLEQFKRYYHTIEAHAKREKCAEVIHKLRNGEVIRNTRLENVGG